MYNFINFLSIDDKRWGKSDGIVLGGFGENSVFLEDVAQVGTVHVGVAVDFDGVHESSSSNVS